MRQAASLKINKPWRCRALRINTALRIFAHRADALVQFDARLGSPTRRRDRKALANVRGIIRAQRHAQVPRRNSTSPRLLGESRTEAIGVRGLSAKSDAEAAPQPQPLPRKSGAKERDRA